MGDHAAGADPTTAVTWSGPARILTIAARRSLRSVWEKIQREEPEWVIIRRAVDWQAEPYLYAFRTHEILEWVRDHPERLDDRIEEVLDLRESGSSRVTRSWSPEDDMTGYAHSPSTWRAVHVDADGRPTDVGETAAGRAAAPPPPDLGPARSVRRRRGGQPPVEPSPAVGDGAAPVTETVEVTISAESASEVESGTIQLIDYRIEVSGEARPLRHRMEEGVVVAKDESIRVLLSTHGDAVSPVGARVQEVSPPASGRPTIGAFEIQALQPGTAELALSFWQGGTQLGAIHVSITIVAATPRPGTARARVTAEPRDRADDDMLILLIDQRKEGDAIRYEYRLHSESLGLNYLTLSSEPLQDRGHGAAATTQAYVEWIYERVGEEVRNWDDARRLARGLRTIGMDMCEQLFDPDVTRRLWDARDKLGMVQVTSWEPYIPWEILRLKDPNTGDADDRFLCEYGLVRSLPGEAQPRSLRMEQWSFLAARYPNGLEDPVGSEVDYFRRTLPQRGIQPVEIQPAYDPFFDALEAGEFDVLHLACHGEAQHDQIDNSVLIIGDEVGPGGAPRPIAVDEKAVRHDARLGARRPIVFLNACSSARHGPSLTAWGGWPTAFLKAGAGVFVGSSWPVRERPAAAFAETFYDTLQGGATLAEAAAAARAATKDMGDGSWLAYKVYGHPRARMVSSDGA
jgi:hypothetical protein